MIISCAFWSFFELEQGVACTKYIKSFDGNPYSYTNIYSVTAIKTRSHQIKCDSPKRVFLNEMSHCVNVKVAKHRFQSNGVGLSLWLVKMNLMIEKKMLFRALLKMRFQLEIVETVTCTLVNVLIVIFDRPGLPCLLSIFVPATNVCVFDVCNFSFPVNVYESLSQAICRLSLCIV